MRGSERVEAVSAASPARVAHAAAWMSGGIAALSAMAVAGRELSAELDTFEIMFWRSAVGVPLVLGLAVATGALGSLRTRRIGLHLTRNLFHFAAQNLWFFALAAIPLAQVFALEFTTPLWVLLLAPLVLRERFTRQGAVAVALGFVGILVITRPGMVTLEIAHGAALLAAIGFAAQVLATRALAATESTLCVLWWMTTSQMLMGALCAAPGAFAAPSTERLGWLGLIGVCGIAAHFCITNALRSAPASVVSPMDFARLPTIAVVGALLYGEAMELAVFAGGALIVVGNLLTPRAGAERTGS